MMQSIPQLPDGVHGLCSGKSNCYVCPKTRRSSGTLPFLHTLVLFLPKLYALGHTMCAWKSYMLRFLKCTHLLNYENITVLAFVITYKTLFFPSAHPTTIKNICRPQSVLENAIRKLNLKEFVHASFQSCWKFQVSLTLLCLKRGRLHKAPKGTESVFSDLSRGTSNHGKMKLEERQSSYHLRSVVNVIQHLVMSITQQLLYHS